MRSLGITAVIAAGAMTFIPFVAGAAENLRVGGTGAINEAVRGLAPAFAAETGIAIQLVPSMGTSGGNSALADGVLDVSVSGRPLNAKEKASGLKAVAEMRTPYGLVTSLAKPNALRSAELAQLYQSDKPIWADGTPIRIILRPSNDSDTALLGQLFPSMSEAIVKARSRADLSVAATDQDNADMAEKMPGSLVGATLTQIKMEKRNLRFVAIDGVGPSLESFENGSYPLGKSLYVVVGPNPNAAAISFVAFVRSPKGVAALREAGLLLSVE
ncbi:MAG: substrate-binding domain-containing protein [Pseudolabrys sp.]|nr:substrate-binding domain-containing protein [Pseudolabrys sp.]